MITLFTFCLSIFNMIIRGYLIVALWNWFVITSFNNVPPINVFPAIGFSLLASSLYVHRWITQQERECSRDERDQLVFVNAGTQTVTIAISWLAGYIIHLFM